MWAAELSADGRAELFITMRELSDQTAYVYVWLMLYIADFTSAPTDGRLERITGVTPNCFRDQHWPYLQGIFEWRHGRLYHRGLAAADPFGADPWPPEAPSDAGPFFPVLLRGGQP